MSPQAVLETRHADPERVASALRPDNTTEMETTVEPGTVRTVITRDTLAGLGSTVDDYVVNLRVAETVAQHANRSTEGHPSNTNDTQ